MGIPPALFRGVGGVLLGLVVDLRALPIDKWSRWALMLLLLLIGIQMRNSGMRLRQILLNPWGMKIALTVILGSWLGGLLARPTARHALCPWPRDELQFWLVFALRHPGSRQAGPRCWAPPPSSTIWGASLSPSLIIPVLMRRHPSAAIGYGGATALDFTLPVIQKSGGIQVVPVAIVSGFILSLLGPILILGFLAI